MKLRKDARVKLVSFPDLKVDKHVVSMGNGFAKGSFLNTPMSNRFKEKPEVRAAIEAKAMQLAPAFNKGPVQYIPKGDEKYIGRK